MSGHRKRGISCTRTDVPVCQGAQCDHGTRVLLRGETLFSITCIPGQVRTGYSGHEVPSPHALHENKRRLLHSSGLEVIFRSGLSLNAR